ncbi:MAG: cobyrinate a,c-diamide synthase [Nitrososphaeria archaeon]
MLIDKPRIVITAPNSSSGKTLATMGIIYGLRTKGYKVQPFKIGPDFIDPSYLESVSGVHAINLDLWLMGRSGLLRAFSNGCIKSDVCVIEGVMGYLDGAYTTTDKFFGSTYRISHILKSNIIAVIDISKTAQTTLAIVLGLAKFSRGKIGIILNRVANDGHAEYVKQAVNGYSNIVYLGHIYEDKSLALEERKLGLVPTSERAINAINISKKASEKINIDAVISLMRRDLLKVRNQQQVQRNSQIKISVALDEAFNFYYWDSIYALKVHGADVEYFSPVNDVPPSESTNGIIIGGGFPELFANKLNKSRSTIKFLGGASANGIPILAECGGLMYLTKGIYDSNKFYRWAGIFDAKVKMTDRLTIGYSELDTKMDNPISSRGQQIKGHEFHYSNLVEVSMDQNLAFKVIRGSGIDGLSDGLLSYNSIGIYSHLHLGSNINALQKFLNICSKSNRR